jgi:hypothetical protein
MLGFSGGGCPDWLMLALGLVGGCMAVFIHGFSG